MLASLALIFCLLQGVADPLPESFLDRGIQLQNLHQYEQAESLFKQITPADPNYIIALEHLRRLYIDQQKNPQLIEVLVLLVDGYQKNKAYQPANARLDELLLLDPTHKDRLRLEQITGRIKVSKKSDELHLEQRARSAFGILLILAIAYVMSINRKAIRWRVVAWGLGLQISFAWVILWTSPGRWFFDKICSVVTGVLSFTDYGARFLFGNLYDGMARVGNKGPVQILDGTSGDAVNLGIVFVFHVLPIIVFFGALMSVLYHFGILQKAVRAIAFVMSRTMGTSGAESLSAAGNIFLGQTEAPLLIKPYIGQATRSEIMAIMTGGFATVAGSVLGAFVRFGIDPGHLLSASVMAAPGSLLLAKMMVPETDQSLTKGGEVKDPERTTSNVIDAATTGAIDGFALAANVAAMLIAFIALVAMVNYGLGWFNLSLQEIFGYLLYPLSWSMGVPYEDLLAFGNLLGTKVSLNEFVAYIDLTHMKNQISERTYILATYALCGFANFSSIGVQIGGISALAPNRRKTLVELGLRAMIAGALASCLTACIAGVML